MPKLWANGWVSSSDDTRFICSNTVGCTKYENADFYTGEKTWIIITTVTGLIVGLIRFFSKYPEDLPGLFKEIHSYHVEPKWAPWSFLISLISLAGGACLGPEQALVSSNAHSFVISANFLSLYPFVGKSWRWHHNLHF